MNQTELARQQPKSLVNTLATKYGIEPTKLLESLRNTYFKTKDAALTNEEMAAALIVCNTYDLNPFLREVHATRTGGRLLVMVGIDGWIKIAQRSGQFDGMKIEDKWDEEGKPYSVTVTVYRKDQKYPTEVTSYFSEYRRDTEPWKQFGMRMLRHKGVKEALRYAFSISGIDDEDVGEGSFPTPPPVPQRSSRVLNLTSPEPPNKPLDILPEPEQDMREPGQEG
jgi:phage recombination protein Bet